MGKKLHLGEIMMLFRQGLVIKASGQFDAAYYRSQYADVAKAGVYPLFHYLRHGAKEGRDPSGQFNTMGYLRRYPDVKASGLNPLYHYVKYGRAEGREAKAPAGYGVDFEERLTSSALASNEATVLILDHNYGGGASKYLNNMLNNASDPLLRSFRAYFWLNDNSFRVEMRKGSRVIEKAAYSMWQDFSDDFNQIKFSTIIINELYAWPSAKKVLAWITAYKKEHPSVRVEFKGHDYYSICPSFTLQDAQHRYCGIRCDETGCSDCIRLQGTQHAYLDHDNAEKFSITAWRKMWNSFLVNTVDVLEVFSPSSQKIFQQAYPGVANKLKLVPHKILSFDCCNVAILGHSYIHKGSEIVRKLCAYLDENQIEDMRLYMFGWNGGGIVSKHLKEMGEYERPDLPEKLKKAKIDLVFIPSICPETFCYTAGESISLGYPTACFDLGGQADQVRASDNGVILYSDEPDYLYTTFKSLMSKSRPADGAVDAAKPAAEGQTKTIVLQDRTSREFLQWMYQQRSDKSHFVPEAEDDIKMSPGMPKVIACYLPQFHDFPENVRWFGKGFSEWTNTSQTLPQFMGHRQPQVPIDVGYYNLSNTDVMHRQVELARKYGVSGFCVYYYWFSGTKLMDQPLKNILADKSLDFPFFLFWANDDWTMAWGNGDVRETLYKGNVSPDEADMFMEDVLPYMRDSRYIKIGNKPVLLIYKIALVAYEDYMGFVKRIQEIAKKNGFDGIYLLSPIEDFMDHEHLEDTQKRYMLDALMEFHPIAGRKGWNLKQENYLDPACRSICSDVDDFVANKKYILDTRAKVFPGLFPNWDNSPRRYNRGASILQNTPENYKVWLSDLIRWTNEHNQPDERFIFVNAWNEWAECAHLEPDSYYGYAYLQKTREALEESESNQADS